MNKKGDLLNNILTTVIAIAGLLIIIYATYRLYSVYANQDSENAKNNANIIEAKINSIDAAKSVGEKIPASIVIKSVPKWFISGWGEGDAGRPDKCAFQTCICVCPDKSEGVDVKLTLPDINLGIFESRKELCQAGGFCRFFAEDELVFQGTEIDLSRNGIKLPRAIILFDDKSNLAEFFASKYYSGDKKVIYISLIK